MIQNEDKTLFFTLQKFFSKQFWETKKCFEKRSPTFTHTYTQNIHTHTLLGLVLGGWYWEAGTGSLVLGGL